MTFTYKNNQTNQIITRPYRDSRYSPNEWTCTENSSIDEK